MMYDMSQDEAMLLKAFRQIDFDGNGFIGVSELRYLLTVLGEELLVNWLTAVLTKS